MWALVIAFVLFGVENNTLSRAVYYLQHQGVVQSVVFLDGHDTDMHARVTTPY